MNFLTKSFGLKKKGSFFLSGVYLEGEKALCGPVLGAPQAAIVLEYLKACGVKEVLGLGWAGALVERLALGSFFLPEEAFSAEGTSALYGRFLRPSQALFWWVYHQLVAMGLNFEVGSIVSTDALFREDEAFLARYPEALAIDMETSALFSVGKALSLEVANLLIISDRLKPEYEKAPSKFLQKSLAALLPLIRNFWSGNS